MEDAVILEFMELNEYVRHETSVYFAWLSFFLTIVLGAMAWALKTSLGSKGLVDHFPATFIVLLGFFLIQIVLGIRATTSVLQDVRWAEQRAKAILRARGNDATVLVPFAYGRAVELARHALIANLVFWPIVALAVLAAWRFKLPLGVPPGG